MNTKKSREPVLGTNDNASKLKSTSQKEDINPTIKEISCWKKKISTTEPHSPLQNRLLFN